MSIIIRRAGLLTTIQDGGRWGNQTLGFSVSGAMDLHALRIGNLLLGNDEDEAGVEMTILGPTLEFTCDAVIAVTGADLSAALDGTPLEMYRAVQVKRGQTLTFPRMVSGCRGYVTVAGGLDVPPVMGSRSTYIKGALGGLDGHALHDGDELPLRSPSATLPHLERRYAVTEPIDAADTLLRVVRGPQQAAFTDAGTATFFSSAYTVTAECDRMGARLDGPIIEHVKDGNTISDGIPLGGIQVPTGGTPIIMLSDKQCIGGYTKIATVISCDLQKIAQCKPGDRVRFTEVTVHEAQALYLARRRDYDRLRRWVADGYTRRTLSVRINGKEYETLVNDRRPVRL